MKTDKDGDAQGTALDETLPVSDRAIETVASLPEATKTGEVARGTSIGRFVVIDRIGAGGMGIVLAAFDPDLDRKVAIKLLRSAARDVDEEDARVRLQREAQAMAKLSHPNVVTVHEVGEVDGQVFLAMEFVDGGTLRTAKQRAKGWRPLLDLYRQAGRGLAAAHRVGLVHRDFKPDNVLVTRDGRAQVTDFGLVGIKKRSKPDPSASLSDPLTRTGSILGTPAYMAPEQHLGETVDARADQFSFCVALYEALYDARPFAGNTYEELAANVMAGAMKTPPAADVPVWLRKVLIRGMSRRPTDRYSSMDELLDELAYERHQRRRRVAIVVAGFGLVALLAVGAVWFARSDTPAFAPCEGADDHLAGVWDANVRRNMTTAFERASLGYGGEALARTTASLDDYTRKWVEDRTEACRATLRGEQSEALLDRRMYCLDGRLASVRSLVQLFANADAALVAKSVELAANLPPLAACADTEALSASYPPPADPAKRIQLRDAQTRAREIATLRNSGRLEEAIRVSKQILDIVRAIDHPPLLAETLFDTADALRLRGERDAAIAMLREAAGVAAKARDDRRVATSYGLLYHMLVLGSTRPDEAEAVKPYMESAFARIENDVEARSLYISLAANRALLAGKFDDALALYRSDPSLRDPANQPIKATLVYTSIGSVLRQQGKLDEALVTMRKAEELARLRLGEHNPVTAKAGSSIGTVYLQKGDLAQATTWLKKAFDAQELALGPKSEAVAETSTLLGLVAEMQGNLDEATRLFERSHAAYLAANGPDHVNVAYPLANLGKVHARRGDFKRARESFVGAARIFERSFAPTHPLFAELHMAIAAAHGELGDQKAAQESYERALKIYEAMPAPRPPGYMQTLSGQALSFARGGKHREARELSTRASEMAKALRGPEGVHLHLVHARILELGGDKLAARAALESLLETARATGGDEYAADAESRLAKLLDDRRRARELMTSAVARYAKLGDRVATARRDAEKWLTDHP